MATMWVICSEKRFITNHLEKDIQGHCHQSTKKEEKQVEEIINALN